MYLRVQKGYKTVQAKQKLKVTPIGEKNIKQIIRFECFILLTVSNKEKSMKV